MIVDGLHTYQWGDGDRVVMWHHGTPNVGSPPRPLFAAAERLGVRFISYDRPGYGGSAPRPGRDMASAAELAATVADALGVDRFGVLGHSSGGPHALACAALLPDRVTGAVSISGLAPFSAHRPSAGAGDDPGADRHAGTEPADPNRSGSTQPADPNRSGGTQPADLDWFGGTEPADLDWFAGMGPAGLASLGAAVAGREAKEAHAASGDDGVDFTPQDWAALEGEWGWFGSVVAPALAGGPAPLIDDDLASVAPWGFDPATIRVPVLLVHGSADAVVPSSHSTWLAGRIPGAELRIVPGAGHISVLPPAAIPALEWLSR